MDVIAAHFDERLRYDNGYTVTVSGVASAFLAQQSTIYYSLTTDSPESFFLDRCSPDDQIVTAGLTRSHHEVVYSGTRIQDFRALLNFVAVVSLNDDRTSSLQLASLRDGVSEKVLLPDAIPIGELYSSTSGNRHRLHAHRRGLRRRPV